MVRRILVPLDPSPYAQAAQTYAFEVAKGHNAEVTALGVIDTPAIHNSVSHVSPGAMVYAKKAEDRREQEAHDRLQEMVAAFEARAQQENVTHRSVLVQGSPAEQISYAARFYDALVLGLRTHYKFETSDQSCNTLHDMIGELATPVLVVPENYKPIEELDVVIAFDGGFAATRSLRQFATLTAYADPHIILLTASDDQHEAEHIQVMAEEYLTAYDYNNISREWVTGDINASIKDKYEDIAELIVLGTHTKKSWFDFGGIGSLANYLLRESNTPLFIGQ